MTPPPATVTAARLRAAAADADAWAVFADDRDAGELAAAAHAARVQADELDGARPVGLAL